MSKMRGSEFGFGIDFVGLLRTHRHLQQLKQYVTLVKLTFALVTFLKFGVDDDFAALWTVEPMAIDRTCRNDDDV